MIKTLKLSVIKDGEQREHIIQSGFKQKSKTLLISTDSFVFYIKKNSRKVLFCGYMTKPVLRKFESYPEGSKFKFNKIDNYRLTEDEIEKIISRNPFEFDDLQMK